MQTRLGEFRRAKYKNVRFSACFRPDTWHQYPARLLGIYFGYCCNLVWDQALASAGYAQTIYVAAQAVGSLACFPLYVTLSASLIARTS